MFIKAKRTLAAVAGFLVIAWFTPRLSGQTSDVAHTAHSALPPIDDFPVGFNEGIEHLHLKHCQHEQVEQIVTSEAIQLTQNWGKDNLSVARRFEREQPFEGGPGNALLRS